MRRLSPLLPATTRVPGIHAPDVRADRTAIAAPVVERVRHGARGHVVEAVELLRGKSEIGDSGESASGTPFRQRPHSFAAISSGSRPVCREASVEEQLERLAVLLEDAKREEAAVVSELARRLRNRISEIVELTRVAEQELAGRRLREDVGQTRRQTALDGWLTRNRHDSRSARRSPAARDRRARTARRMQGRWTNVARSCALTSSQDRCRSARRGTGARAPRCRPGRPSTIAGALSPVSPTRSARAAAPSTNSSGKVSSDAAGSRIACETVRT